MSRSSSVSGMLLVAAPEASVSWAERSGFPGSDRKKNRQNSLLKNLFSEGPVHTQDIFKTAGFENGLRSRGLWKRGGRKWRFSNTMMSYIIQRALWDFPWLPSALSPESFIGNRKNKGKKTFYQFSSPPSNCIYPNRAKLRS